MANEKGIKIKKVREVVDFREPKYCWIEATKALFSGAVAQIYILLSDENASVPEKILLGDVKKISPDLKKKGAIKIKVLEQRNRGDIIKIKAKDFENNMDLEIEIIEDSAKYNVWHLTK
ncbi:MAG: hypothetical protein GF370_03565 [Candidatus Nealsonbacteria bacterium]|nr:hypothetical protein [Candidatus Nealsonbacteria bacterium]